MSFLAPRPLFLPFHQRTQRWSCIVAHRRAGKTVATIEDIISAAVSCKKALPRYSYVAPFRGQAKDIAWTYLKQFTDNLRHGEPSEVELSVTLRGNGAKIRLYGADNDQALRGVYNDGVVIDEPADMRPRVWGEIIRPTLSDRQGWATFIGTPKGHNNFYDIHQKALLDPANWFHLILKASETSIIPPDELADLQRTMLPDQFQQEYECSFEAAVLGAYFGLEMNQAESEGRISEVPYDPSVPVHTAWDLGYHDDTSIWFYQIFAREIHFIDFYSDNGKSIEDLATIIKSKPYRYATHWMPHDARPTTLSSGGRSIMEQFWKDHNIRPHITPDLSRQDGIQAARKMLPRCWFDRKACFEGIEALKLYQREWDDDKKVFREQPRHDWTSHAADAFRYAAVNWVQPTEANKPNAPENSPNPKHAKKQPLPVKLIIPTWDQATAKHDRIIKKRLKSPARLRIRG